eukprot:TRINITY_DN6367_c0_g1_i1.p1 TRINITY_DN6367_c0_g1~~TRINITY_DN6367_c0_g1_i1.p1  ORF type:complete len:110 (+),score=2.48 TRINITY_DN6367_c0_g1_i1:50-379(+)
MNHTNDGELDFPSAAAVLAPQRTLPKLAMLQTWLNCRNITMEELNVRKTGITEYEDLHAPHPTTRPLSLILPIISSSGLHVSKTQKSVGWRPFGDRQRWCFLNHCQQGL